MHTTFSLCAHQLREIWVDSEYPGCYELGFSKHGGTNGSLISRPLPFGSIPRSGMTASCGRSVGIPSSVVLVLVYVLSSSGLGYLCHHVLPEFTILFSHGFIFH